MSRVRVVADHESPPTPPLSVSPGEEVNVGRQSTEWPAFVHVESRHGSGWVPSRYLALTGQSAVVETAYDTKELDARAGEVLELLRRDDESGWHWCRNQAGEEGWVPLKVLERID